MAETQNFSLKISSGVILLLCKPSSRGDRWLYENIKDKEYTVLFAQLLDPHNGMAYLRTFSTIKTRHVLSVMFLTFFLHIFLY